MSATEGLTLAPQDVDALRYFLDVETIPTYEGMIEDADNQVDADHSETRLKYARYLRGQLEGHAEAIELDFDGDVFDQGEADYYDGAGWLSQQIGESLAYFAGTAARIGDKAGLVRVEALCRILRTIPEPVGAVA